jgi:hypothetical protein
MSPDFSSIGGVRTEKETHPGEWIPKKGANGEAEEIVANCVGDLGRRHAERPSDVTVGGQRDRVCMTALRWSLTGRRLE